MEYHSSMAVMVSVNDGATVGCEHAPLDRGGRCVQGKRRAGRVMAVEGLALDPDARMRRGNQTKPNYIRATGMQESFWKNAGFRMQSGCCTTVGRVRP